MLEMIVVFAHWCPTCKMMMPLIEEVAEDYKEQIETTWLDMDKYPEVIEPYEIQIVPTLILKCEQKEVGRMAGMIGESVLRERMEAFVKNTCISEKSVI